ncbi:PD-(D/E)XK nuclease family protein [Dietzia maris]|uniref:PD-(D/E)XK nuclease family protein n=1 Tax=Dietzia maris TaxID=37915 RepID=UPI00142D8CF2
MVDEWETAFRKMAELTRQQKNARTWRSGHRTLVRELGLHRLEVYMCRGLAWLLTPDGWHGLGSEYLSAFLELLALSVEGAEQASVTTEETRGDTRADIIVRTTAATVLIEAKISAPEGARQADRLAEGWSPESPSFVFLTSDGGVPATAVESVDQWRTLRWQDLGAIGRVLMNRIGPETIAPGARDLIETLEMSGERPATVDDSKLDFYLHHREQILEWSDLHGQAVHQLSTSLRKHLEPVQADPSERFSVWESLEGSIPLLQLKVPGPDGLVGGFLELQWRPSDLLRPGLKFEWPQLIICSHPDAGAKCRQEVQQATQEIATSRGMALGPNRWWIWRAPLAPEKSITDLDEYARDCVRHLLELWESVGPAIAEAHSRLATTPR